MRISDWSSDVCSADLGAAAGRLSDDPGADPVSGRQSGSHEPDRHRTAGTQSRRDGRPAAHEFDPRRRDRKSVVSGKSLSVRVDLGGLRIIKKKNQLPTIVHLHLYKV